MKIIPLVVLVFLLVFIAACQQPKIVEKPAAEKPVSATTGEAAVDAVSSGISNVDSVERDLSSDELSDVDSGLADVQGI